jgi:hypothetical protein
MPTTRSSCISLLLDLTQSASGHAFGVGRKDDGHVVWVGVLAALSLVRL